MRTRSGREREPVVEVNDIVKRVLSADGRINRKRFQLVKIGGQIRTGDQSRYCVVCQKF